MAATNEAKIREACNKLDSKKTHRIDKIRLLAGIEDQAFDDTLAKLAGEGVIELLGGDTSEMTAEQIAGLYKSGDDDLPLVNLVWQMESTPVLWRYRHELAEERERLKGANPTELAMEMTGIKKATVNAFLKIMPFFHSEFDKLEANFESLKRSKSTLEDVYKSLLAEHDDLKAGTLQRIDSLENTLAKVKTERDFLKKSAMELSDELTEIRHEGNDYRRRINTLEEAHKELFKEIDIRNKEISKLRAQTHQTPTTTPEPEPKQIKLFDDEGEKDMRDHAAQIEIQTIKGQMAEMQATFTAELAKIQNQMSGFFARPAPAEVAEPTTTTTSTKKKIKDPTKPENIRVGAWNLNPVKRGSAWFFRAFRTYPGMKSPACVYVGKDTSRENVEKCLIAYNKKKGTDYQID